MTLLAWTVMLVLAFVSLAWARNRFQLSVYYLSLAALCGSLILAEEQLLALTHFFMSFNMPIFLSAFVASCVGLALLVRELNRTSIEQVFEVAETEPELELEAQPAV